MDLERGHEHDEECHQLTEKKVKRMIAIAGVGITGALLVLTVVGPIAKAFVISLIVQAPK